MPRPPRRLHDNGCYHILTRGNNRAAVFHADVDRRRYGHWLLGLSQEYGVQVYHYCLMTNHVHLVVRATVGPALRAALQRLNLLYAQYLHRTYGHVGHVWQDRFKSLRITTDAYLLQCGSYIELNPVRAHIVSEPTTYPWSSSRYYAEGHPDPLVTPSPAYVALGETSAARQMRYRRFVEQQVTLPADWLRQQVLGTPRPPGRPRKSPLQLAGVP